MVDVAMDRREFIQVGAALLGAALLGAAGGLTSTEEGRKPKRKDEDEDEPPREERNDEDLLA